MATTLLSQTARTLYAELREQALIASVTPPLGAPPGAIVRKTIKGREYLYLQLRDLDGRMRQRYLGPASDERTARMVARLAAHRGDHDGAQVQLQRLRAAFLAAGGSALAPAPFRVIQAFAHAGVLTPGAPGGGAVLIGTHAFQCLGNVLGVRWQAALNTQDVDLAAEVDQDIELAVARPDLPAGDVLTRLEMGFLPVPTLDPRSPSTSYFVRGQELRVDLLTPMTGRASGPRFVPAFGAAAAPVRHLDFLLVEPIAVLALSTRDLAVVQVPDPARFGLHKLMVSVLRPAVFATKADKDRLQAMQVLRALLDSAPDELPRAWRELVERGSGWTRKVHQALKACRRLDEELVAELLPLLPQLR